MKISLILKAYDDTDQSQSTTIISLGSTSTQHINTLYHHTWIRQKSTTSPPHPNIICVVAHDTTIADATSPPQLPLAQFLTPHTIILTTSEQILSTSPLMSPEDNGHTSAPHHTTTSAVTTAITSSGAPNTSHIPQALDSPNHLL